MNKPKLILKSVTIQRVDNIATGKTVEEFRKSKGVTLVELGDRIGFSPTYLSFLERGKRNWNNQLLSIIVKALDHENT